MKAQTQASGRALEKICNDDVLGGKMFSIQAGFIDLKIRNHKIFIILRYIEFLIQYFQVYEEKLCYQLMVSEFEINKTCLN